MNQTIENDRIESIISDHYSIVVKEQYIQFGKNILELFTDKQCLSGVIHTLKYRVKSDTSLRDKIRRKYDRVHNGESLRDIITDFVGVRVLVLFSHQLETIHNFINSNIGPNGVQLFEAPKAYTWDPEMKSFFERLGLICEAKDSLYTSLHYVVKPNTQSTLTCEIQVRTLYEEIWGEIDHMINYPYLSTNTHCVEQLKVLARLTTTGSKLLDSIYKSHINS